MLKRLSFAMLILFSSIALACALPGAGSEPVPDSNFLNTQVAIALTQTALAQPTPALPAMTDTPAPTPATTGSISGMLAYPSEGIPALKVYALAVEGDQYYSVQTQENQTEFTIEGIAPGIYYVIAYLPNAPTTAGAWSQFVVCGLTAECTDHSLIPVTVEAGKTAAGVKVHDWYALPGTFPAEPGVTIQSGAISGVVGFPSESIPPMSVYAIAVNENRYYYVDIQENQTQFTIEGVAPGTYYVVAYLQSTPEQAGAWTQFVPCGLSANCNDHSLLPVVVNPGQTTTGVEVKDWYTQPGTFPARPGS